jgi:hypothetical protein
MQCILQWVVSFVVDCFALAPVWHYQYWYPSAPSPFEVQNRVDFLCETADWDTNHWTVWSNQKRQGLIKEVHTIESNIIVISTDWCRGRLARPWMPNSLQWPNPGGALTSFEEVTTMSLIFSSLPMTRRSPARDDAPCDAPRLLLRSTVLLQLRS